MADVTTPRLDKLPFWLADATLLIAAAMIVRLASHPLGLLEMLPMPPLTLGSPVGIARLDGRRQRPAALLFSECFKQAVQTELPDRLVIP